MKVNDAFPLPSIIVTILLASSPIAAARGLPDSRSFFAWCSRELQTPLKSFEVHIAWLHNLSNKEKYREERALFHAHSLPSICEELVTMNDLLKSGYASGAVASILSFSPINAIALIFSLYKVGHKGDVTKLI